MCASSFVPPACRPLPPARHLCSTHPLNQACGFPRRVFFSLDTVHIIVALFSGVSAFKNRLFIKFAAPRAPLRCVVFVSTVLWVLFVLGYWSATLPLSESLVLPVRFFTTRILPSHITTNCAARRYLLVSSPLPCVSLLYHFVSLHLAKGFALQAPEYILFTLSVVTSL